MNPRKCLNFGGMSEPQDAENVILSECLKYDEDGIRCGKEGAPKGILIGNINDEIFKKI